MAQDHTLLNVFLVGKNLFLWSIKNNGGRLIGLFWAKERFRWQVLRKGIWMS